MKTNYYERLREVDAYFDEILNYISLEMDGQLVTQMPPEVALEIQKYVDDKYGIVFTRRGKLSVLDLSNIASNIHDAYSFQSFLGIDYDFNENRVLDMLVAVLRQQRFDEFFDDCLKEQREYYANKKVAQRLLKR